MPYRLEIDLPEDVFKAVSDTAIASPLMRRVWQQQTRGIANELLRRVSTPPGGVKRPIQWASEKQRRAYFATNGFGKGIPYKRSGKQSRSWEVKYIFTQADGILTLESSSPVTPFVQGSMQQPFHHNTGWPRADLEAAKFQDDLENITIESWFIVVDQVFQR